MDGRGQDSGSSYQHDEGIERPPSIGLDERRMHVRAYNYWASLLGSRLYPALDDFDPAALDDFGPHGVVLNFTDPAHPRLIFIGNALRDECGLAEDIADITDVPSRSLLSRLTDHYLEVIANRAPIGFEAEFVGRRGNNTMYRGILMPLSSDGQAIDNIYGVINWKEVADVETTATLAAEVDRALAQRPTFVSMNAVWADTPSLDLPGAGEPAGGKPLPEPYSPPESDLTEVDPDAPLDVRLAAAREASRQAAAALGRALALCYDLALASEGDPALPMLLAGEGIARPSRVSLSTVVRLVLGTESDRAIIRGFVALLEQGLRAHVPQGRFEAFLESQTSGLATIAAAARASRRRR